jgi:hypothetical protein
MRILIFTGRVLLFLLLTLLTQVGGLVYLVSLTTHKLINQRTSRLVYQKLLHLASFIFLYCLTTFAIVPLIASPFGRVPLPLTATNHLQPLNVLTCLLNRNYVKPALKQAAFDVAEEMNAKFPGTVVNYLDASFPFWNGFPLFPHLSHNDGKKLDLAFCYTDAGTGKATNECPSFIGYGICEEPLPGENNTADFCAGNGYWQYSLMRKVMPQGNKKSYPLDAQKTKLLVNLFAAQQAIGKIFIEPHLKVRWGLTTEKIRFHGCQAVRHDDHIHVQLK